MLKSASAAAAKPKPEISELFQRLSQDGREWAEAEIKLAKLELGDLRRNIIKIVAAIVTGFAAVLCMLVVLSQSAVSALTPHVGSGAMAGIIVGGVLLLLAIASLLAMRSGLTWRPESIFFKWFSRSTRTGRHA